MMMHHVFLRPSCRFCVRSGSLSGGTNIHAAFGVSDEWACGGGLRGDRFATRWGTRYLFPRVLCPCFLRWFQES